MSPLGATIQKKGMIDKLSLDEKMTLLNGLDFWHLHGLERLGLPSIMVTDGPHGLRKQKGSADHVGLNQSVPATCFPTASALASTWNKPLLYKLGEALGEECLTEKVSVLLGPGVNLKRHPLCGRNFEYFSEDPFLAGHLAAQWILGVQSKGVGTSLKHYAVNNQESYRMVTNAIIDERSLRELYLKSFEIAVKEAQPWTVMSSYNKINGVYGSEHALLLQEVLKDSWQHKGLVITDWGANNDRVKGLIAGQELEMPGNGGLHKKALKKAFKKGEFSEALLNQRVQRILDLMIKAKTTLEKAVVHYDAKAHHQLARKIAHEGMVLLKNDDAVLPLKKNETVALIGAFAKKPRYQGSGSSLIQPTELSTAYEAFNAEIGAQMRYHEGYDLTTDTVDERCLNDALKQVKDVDKVVVMVGLTDAYESEGFDRDHLDLPMNHTALIEALCKAHKKVIVCLSNGAPVAMPWKGRVSGIVEQYLAGQASGEALVDLLYGKVNFSGKLAETFPNTLAELPSNANFPGTSERVEYREGLYVGYRAYHALERQPLFPFGYGLSYTTFRYNNLRLKQKDNRLMVCLEVMNQGDVEGAEIVQVYVGKEDSVVYRPKRELKAFDKVFLTPGETKRITMMIKTSDLGVYQGGAFRLEAGMYTVEVGASSEDIRLHGEVKLSSKDEVNADHLTAYTVSDGNFCPSIDDFEALLGYRLPPVVQSSKLTMNSPLEDVRQTWLGQKLYAKVLQQFATMIDDEMDEGTAKMFKTMVDEMPFRNLLTFSQGKLSLRRGQGLLDLMNKQVVKGLFRVLTG